MLFDELIFQTLHRIELINPLRLPNQSPGIVGDSLLADGMVLHFNESAMVCTLPRRDSPCQHGTTLCLSDDGERQSLGYRLTVLDSEDADPIFLSCLYRTTILAQDWMNGGDEHALMLLLAEFKQVDSLWAISMRLLNGCRFNLIYRADFHCIEFAPNASVMLAAVSPNQLTSILYPLAAITCREHYPHKAITSMKSLAEKDN